MGATQAIVGCCGWTEAQARYIANFSAIELQTTFYQPPANSVAQRWKSLAPSEFTFCMKAWQLITHTPSSPTYRRLKSGVSLTEQDLYGSFRPTEQVWLAWERTREIAEILDAKVIVFQCPKSFLPTRENTRNLTAFFQEIDRDERMLAWEPRGDTWRPELVRELCAENNLIHCVDPFKADPAYGDALYWRLHGRTGYRYRYTEEDFAELEMKLQAMANVFGPNFILFNNIYSKQDAMRFVQSLKCTKITTGVLPAKRNEPKIGTRTNMPKDSHNKAAEHHDNAAKSHRSAAEHHGKGDHATGKKHSGEAEEHSGKAHEASKAAHETSKKQK